MQQEEESSSVSFCPSFNSYSSDNLVDVAARVCREDLPRRHQDDDEDDDFEFISVQTDSDADELFIDGRIGSAFPLFNRDLLLDRQVINCDKEMKIGDVSASRIPLRKLFIEDRDPPSCSSSEADELDGLSPGTYCVWSPKPVDGSPSPGRCKKSNSTGSSWSSKRWRIRDLLGRSHSDGKDSLVFLKVSNSLKKIEEKVEKSEKTEDSKEIKVAGKAKANKEKASAHEEFYVRSRALKEGDKRKSYLPYRQDLVGFFSNMNGMG